MYPSDLTQAQWKLVEPVLKKKSPRGAPGKHPKQTIFNAIVYVLREGCRWRALPRDFPPWQSVYKRLRLWQRRGVWAEAVRVLNVAWRQRKLGRARRLPRHAVVDSQSVKTAAEGEERGFHGGKRVKGRGHHISVDSQGTLLSVRVCAANHHDAPQGCTVMKQAAENFASLESFTGDAAYESVADFAHKGTGLRAAACEKTKAAGFAVIAFRWIVERTFAWFGQCRRLSKD
jgi:putative transposase